MISKLSVLLIPLLIFIGCKLPTENISYEREPVVFGYIDAGLNRIDTLYLSWSSPFSTSHYDIDYIYDDPNINDDVIVTLSSDNNIPNFVLNLTNYNEIEEEYLEGKYFISNYPNDFNITPESTWNLDIQFSDGNENYNLTASTIVPKEINLNSTSGTTNWHCNGETIIISDNFNLYNSENNLFIEKWFNQTATTSDIENIIADQFTYNTNECYTSSFVSIPFFILDLGEGNDNLISRYITIALEKEPFESAIFDTTLSANVFKGPMNYSDDLGWYRDPNYRINLTGDEIPVSWLFFNYYGKHMMIVQPMGDEYERYFQSDPDQFSFPYILREGNVNNAYGLFYSTNSKIFFFEVEKEDN